MLRVAAAGAAMARVGLCCERVGPTVQEAANDLELARLVVMRSCMTRDAFAHWLAAPLLVSLDRNATAPDGGAFVTDSVPVVVPGAGGDSDMVAGAVPQRIFRVRKRHETAYARMVTLGRAGVCDIHFDAPSVSKFHAYFVTDSQGRYLLADAGSKNGTFLNGCRIDLRRAVPVVDGGIIELGTVRMLFLLPETAFDRVLEWRVDG